MTTERTRGRRTPAESRELILEGLRRALARHGWGALTVARVMDETPLGRSSFYVHFDDLPDAAAALMTSLPSLYERPLAAFDASEHTPGALREGVRAAVREADAERAWLIPLLQATFGDETGVLRRQREATFPVASKLLASVPPGPARERLGDAAVAALIADTHDAVMLRLGRDEFDLDMATEAFGLLLHALLFDGAVGAPAHDHD